MRTTNRIAVMIAFAALAACQNKQTEQNIAMDNDAATPNDIETLPADESSATPSNELVNGADNADVNTLGNESNAQ
jgi:hypothetical protein